MKKKSNIIIVLTALFAVGCGNAPQATDKPDNGAENSLKTAVDTNLNNYDSLLCLCRAFVMVESGGKSDAIGDNGSAVGVLQIHPIMVREANKVAGLPFYAYDDRYDSIKSCDLFCTVMCQKNPTNDVKRACEIWNKRAYKSYEGRVQMWYDYYINEERRYRHEASK